MDLSKNPVHTKGLLRLASRLNDPNQNELFSPFAGAFSPLQERHLARSWAGMFRHLRRLSLPT